MTTNQTVVAAALAAALTSSLGGAAAPARMFVELRTHEEVPAVSSAANGAFLAVVNEAAGTIDYELAYDSLTGEVRQAHIHFGQRGVNGGVSVFLCQTATNADPTGLAPPCPPSPARINGRITAANVIGPGAQGIAASELGELIDAIFADVAYVNVHTATFPGGEIRGQFDGRGDRRGQGLD